MAVGVEKVHFPQNNQNLGDRKCLGDPSKSFVGHPDAILFLRISREGVFQQPGDKGQRKDKSKNKKKTSAEPSASAALSSKEVSTASSATSSSEPQPLPPETIQACELRGRQAFE